jgi:hypothetical protein
MFRRGKGKGPVANQLTGAAEPNTLSWVASDAAAAEAELDDDQFVEDEELAEDDEEEEEEDEQTLAQRRADLEAELARQAEEFGLTGSNPTAIYGPNGEDVEAVLDALSAIDTERAEQLADAWAAGDATEREVLERDLLRRSRVGSHGYELTAAEDAVAAWLNAQTPEDDDEAAFWAMVAGAARGAVDALILDEELDDADYDTLYGPWAEVMDTEEDGETGDREGEATGEGPARGPERSTDEPDGEFGPNTELVRQFLVKLDELTPDQAGELTAFWNGQSKGDLRQAHRAMQALASEDEAWREQIRAAQDQITTWTNGPHTVKALRQDRALAAEIAARVAALPPAVDAVSALVLADLLEPEDAEALYAAWDATVGEPKLPEYEEDGTA